MARAPSPTREARALPGIRNRSTILGIQLRLGRQSEAATGLRLRVDFSSGFVKLHCLLFQTDL